MPIQERILRDFSFEYDCATTKIARAALSSNLYEWYHKLQMNSINKMFVIKITFLARAAARGTIDRCRERSHIC
jgi:hypothetical protein